MPSAYYAVDLQITVKRICHHRRKLSLHVRSELASPNASSADALRAQINAAGWAVKDTPAGPELSKL